jgi:hypothetical protein
MSSVRALSLGALLLTVGCAHKKPPPPAAPPPPPPPAGETLKLTPKSGDEPRGKVKLTIEQDLAGTGKGAPKHVGLSFDLLDEEKIESVSADGTAQVTARIVDAVGQVLSGASQPMVDDFALALDELKISFKRSSRGEVVAVVMTGLRPPLEEGTARVMLNAIFSAQRGAILPERPIEVNGTWKVDTALPPSTGFNGLVSYVYTYARKGGGVAIITCAGTIDGKGGGKKMTGKSTGEYRLEVESGRIIGSLVEADVTVEQTATSQPGVKQHVRAEWALQ